VKRLFTIGYEQAKSDAVIGELKRARVGLVVDTRAVAASRDYFERGGEGISFEQVVADLGFTMDQVRGGKGD